jgi:hypothetical protein
MGMQGLEDRGFCGKVRYEVLGTPFYSTICHFHGLSPRIGRPVRRLV